MVRWNGELVEAPRCPRRTLWGDINSSLEHVVGRLALVCVMLGIVAGHFAAPSFGY